MELKTLKIGFMDIANKLYKKKNKHVQQINQAQVIFQVKILKVANEGHYL